MNGRGTRAERAGLVLSLLAAAAIVMYAGAQSPNTQAVSAPSSTAAPAGAANFVDVTTASGVHFKHQASHTARKYLLETMGSGVALFDYDNDGLLDIFFANGAAISDPTAPGTILRKTTPAFSNRLYHQKRDHTFEDVTEKSGLSGAGYSLGVAVGDYDNDGYEDLYVTGYGGNHLYHNNGNGTFSDVTEVSGTGGSGWSTSAAWVDLDGDGLLDLVVLRYVQWNFDDVWCGEHREGYRSYCHPDLFQPVAPLVYHNDGNGHFSEIGRKSGISTPGKGLGIALGDYDRDGLTDLVVANDSIAEHLYRNKGNGTFEEVGMDADVAVDGDGRTYAGMGVAFADYNNDGLPDIAITNLANQKYAIYKNNGDGSFTYTSYMAGVASMSLMHTGWGISFIDYDNDGLKDLLIAQGHDLDNIELTSSTIRYKEPMLLARNTGSGFVDVSSTAGPAFQQAWVGRGLAVGDIFNDGKVDAVVSTNDGPGYLLQNKTSNANHWLGLSLVGHKSNRDAIGAEVKVSSGALMQWGTVSTTGSYLSSSDKRLHFGLGSHSTADSVEILWPSGIRQSLKDVHSDQILTVNEPLQTTSAHLK
ncbi:MAG TPA: CRTAC1 family protein [Acidisarcina sp.]